MPDKKIVAIHQPNFLPWLGYFNKIARADIFVLLDNVQFPKKGGTWTNRVQLLIEGKPAWMTVPVVRTYHGNLNINEIQIDNATPWREKLIKSVQNNYAKAPFFKTIFPFLSELVNNPADSLSEYNKKTVKSLAEAVGLDTSKFILGSTLNTEGAATDLLINITRSVGGNAYLAGGGAGGYQEDDRFAVAGLELIYQDFRHPVYPQYNTSEFVPGLSIIDALMNIGFQGVGFLLKN